MVNFHFFFWTDNRNETNAIAVISFDLIRSSVSVAMQEDYIIFFSGEGERGLGRRLKKMPVTAEIGSNVWTESYCRLL